MMTGSEVLSGSESLGFRGIIGQDRPLKILKNILKKETLPHALLFTGIKGIGKLAAAKAFAMALNCSEKEPRQFPESEAVHISTEPCCVCRPCAKILSGNHPDVIFIEPSGTFIKIDQIRMLCKTLSMKPFEAKMRVVILSHAQAMNAESANAILKMLEEPPDRTLFVLTSERPSDLLPTIASRCQKVRFNPLPERTIETFLVDKCAVDDEMARLLSAMSGGSLSRAREMASVNDAKGNWAKLRCWIIEEIESLPQMPVGHLLALSEKLSKKNDLLANFFELIITWLRDLAIQKYCPEKIINTDLRDRIQKASSRFSIDSLFKKIESVHSAHKRIQMNANLRLTLELMIFQLAAV